MRPFGWKVGLAVVFLLAAGASGAPIAGEKQNAVAPIYDSWYLGFGTGFASFFPVGTDVFTDAGQREFKNSFGLHLDISVDLNIRWQLPSLPTWSETPRGS